MNSFKTFAASALIFCSSVSIIATEPADENHSEPAQRYLQLRQEQYLASNRRRLWLEMSAQFPTLEAFDAAVSRLVVHERHPGQEQTESNALR